MKGILSIFRYFGAKLMRCRGDGSDIKIYSLSFRYNIEHISKQYGLQHATARNANALIVFGKLMVHLSTTGVGEYDHVNKLLHLMASAMMPLGNTDFGRFQAFGEMTSDLAIIKWMNEEKTKYKQKNKNKFEKIKNDKKRG